jgi:hypothetical protein
MIMKTALVVINGLKFPYFLVDHAVDWAKKEGAGLQALFLSSGEVMPEAYAFISDIDLAETLQNIDDTEAASAMIFLDQMKLFNQIIKTEGITGGSNLITDPGLKQVLEKAKEADRLFISPGYGETEQLGVTRFKEKELIDQSPCPVDVVHDPDGVK